MSVTRTKLTKSVPPVHTEFTVRNQSDRLYHGIQAIAVHSTESTDIPHSRDDIISIRNWFNNPASQASAHIGVDGDGHIERWVERHRKAWTILQLNSVTWNIEFVGRAAQPNAAWEDAQIRRAAQYAAYICLKEGIWAQRGRVSVAAGQPYISKGGIIRHKDLTDAGFGTHTDPGPAFPMDEFIALVKHYKKRGWPKP